MGRGAEVAICGPEAAAAELAEALGTFEFSARSCTRNDIADGRCGWANALITIGADTPADRPDGGTHIALADRVVEAADATLRQPAHPIQIAARLRALLRLNVVESAARLRARDVRRAGAEPARMHLISEARSVLYVGQPDPQFLKLRHALSERGAQIVAAFSTFNAFDYLHERGFDAVVLNADPNREVAHTVCSAMRRNTRLYHTPAIILARGEIYAEADEAFARGASDILDARAPSAELCERIMALAGERRRRRDAKGLLEACRVASLIDSETDLFNDAFGRAHLDTLIAHARASRAPLSVVALDVLTPPGAGPADGPRAHHALIQFASMLRHCVRAEDVAVRADAGRFYLVLPATEADQGEVVAARVAAIAECTAYESEDPLQPFRMMIRHRVSQTAAGDDAQSLLKRAFAVTEQARRREAG